MKLSVSVVIPWGNSKSTIDRCIKSVLEQTHRPTEIVVICNNTITRRDGETLQRLYEDKVIVLVLDGFTNANIARNLGAFFSGCSIVAYIDADDWWDAKHLELSLMQMETCGCDLLYSGYRAYLKDGRVLERAARFCLPSETIEQYLLSKCPAPTSSFLVRKMLFHKITWDCSLRRHQDYDFLARAYRVAKVGVKSDITVNYEARNKSYRIPHIEDAFRVTRMWYGLVDRKTWFSHVFYLAKHLFFSLSIVAIYEFLRCLMAKKTVGQTND